MTRPLVARIHLEALRHNYAVARRLAARSRVMAVVKANAYGHGLLRVAGALREADGFAVLALEEALQLRAAGVTQPILMLEGFFSADELPVASAHDVTVAVHCAEQVAALEAARLPRPLRVFLKMNTGMNRLGFRPGEWLAVRERLARCPQVASITAMTHFARAEEAGGVAAQLDVLRRAPAAPPVSLANSGSILVQPADAHGDWARAGIMLYGGSPHATLLGDDFGLRPAMTLESRIIAVQAIAPGEAVGYGGAFVADRAMRVGIVACGYADGYPRHAPTGTPVLVDGRASRTVGRVSMDMLAVDLTGHDAAGIGAPVTLWGEGLSVDRVARPAGTIGYELLCALAPRVPVVED